MAATASCKGTLMESRGLNTSAVPTACTWPLHTSLTVSSLQEQTCSSATLKTTENLPPTIQSISGTQKKQLLKLPALQLPTRTPLEAQHRSDVSQLSSQLQPPLQGQSLMCHTDTAQPAAPLADFSTLPSLMAKDTGGKEQKVCTQLQESHQSSSQHGVTGMRPSCSDRDAQ